MMLCAYFQLWRIFKRAICLACIFSFYHKQIYNISFLLNFIRFLPTSSILDFPLSHPP